MARPPIAGGVIVWLLRLTILGAFSTALLGCGARESRRHGRIISLRAVTGERAHFAKV